ncbi:MAG: glycosyltransferase family 4 protein [Bauldia sp.]
MHFAFAIVSLFPWGGLQRDCLRLARAVAARGHEVTVLAGRVAGALPNDVAVEGLATSGWSNGARNQRFAEALAKRRTSFDRVVGFDKLPGLDFLYCADPSVAARVTRLQRVLPRYRGLIRLEGACFGTQSRTQVLALAETQIAAYRAAWGTPPDRIVLLPPGVDPGRRQPELRADGTRARMRLALGLQHDTLLFLAIGGHARVKGLDRAIDALAGNAAAQLAIVGLSATDGRARGLMRRASRLGVDRRVHWLGAREDVPELMAASDILVHAARIDTTGTVILEAIVNGLPVAATAACGFASHVAGADAGIVLPEPFTPQALDEALALGADPARRRRWSVNAAAYGADPQLYRGIQKAAEILAWG